MIIHTAYLFEAELYRQVIEPLIPEIESGNFHGLYRLAWETIQAEPGIWSFLENIHFGCSEKDFEHEYDPGNVTYWLTVVLGHFLEDTRSFLRYWNSKTFLELALPLAGWTLKEVQLMIYGRSLCTLLSPQRAPKLLQSKYEGAAPFRWCSVAHGWLDIDTIQRLYNKLLQTLQEHPDLYLSEPVQQKMAQFEGQLRRNGFLVACEEAERMLSSAINAGKALYLTES